ncbi:hypothetical protein NUW58_g5945 [Xylaria curta]|uniref:Uncharacterized protein n=1 Tax=Xylaria curta TaxID=42375 RepID=A0ACC1P279_9PEZI|nr:hypothetical protein NUW58_g5945 [Xylaria curta]
MARTTRPTIPVDSSWRMVEEGENDSFDTTIIQDAFDDFMSSQQSQFTSYSQDMPSQDSIRDFAENADEEDVIQRTPFQPSLASVRRVPVDKERTPVPEFFMPTVGLSSPRRSSTRSSNTIRPDADATPQFRRRTYWQESTNESRLGYPTRPLDPRERGPAPNRALQPPSLFKRFASPVAVFLFDCLAWALSVVGMALCFAKWPVAILLAFYVAMGMATVGKNATTQSFSASLQPICRIPGVSFLNLTWCLDEPVDTDMRRPLAPIEFTELMMAQAHFERVVEESTQAVALPHEMRRAESSIRDLRTIVQVSDIPAHEELVYEFDGYLESAIKIVNQLQMLNAGTSSAIDSVTSRNQDTLRFIESIAEKQKSIFSLIPASIWRTPDTEVTDERRILDQYIEHTLIVSGWIERLIAQAQTILKLLSTADDHIGRMHEYVVKHGNAIRGERGEVLWDLWTIVRPKGDRRAKLDAKLQVLQQVETQRIRAAVQLMNLVHDLGDIQTKLDDLRDSVSAPGFYASVS